MDSSLLTAVVLIVVVAGLALFLRSRGGSTPSAAPPASDSVERLLAEVSESDRDSESEEDEEGREIVALTSDGWAFVPDGEEVELIPPGDADDVVPVRSLHDTGRQPSDDPGTQMIDGRGAPVNPRTGRRLTSWKPGEHLDVGDLIAARVVRGAPDYDPWRLEALGRDREYRAWRFETDEAARAALDLVATRIVRPPRDEDGDPIAIGSEDFAEAIRAEEESEAEFANDFPETAEDDPPRPA